jgi:glycosyltransferase involved in cell wall biosynthesis
MNIALGFTKPAIVSDAASFYNLLPEYCVFKSGNATDLASKIRLLLNEKYSQCIKQIVQIRSKNSWENVAKLTVALYRKIGEGSS